jgi:hypothetical protein
MVAIFMDGCIPAEIVKSCKKLFLSSRPSGKSRGDHDDFRVHQRRHVSHPSGEPCLIDLMHGTGHFRVRGFA